MRRKEPTEVSIARIEARTTRTLARWNASRRIVPALAAFASPVATANQVTDSDSPVNWWLVGAIIVLALALFACGVKIWWDRRQKERLRADRTDLEEQNRMLVRENGELSGQLAALQGGGSRPI